MVWKLKVLIQFLLGNVPGGEKINYLLQKSNKSHSLENTKERIPLLINILKIIDTRGTPIKGSNVVEIGTGWQPLCSVLLYLMGAKSIHTFDHVPHVRYGLVKMLISAIEDNIYYIAEHTLVPLNVLEVRLYYAGPGSSDNPGVVLKWITALLVHTASCSSGRVLQ